MNILKQLRQKLSNRFQFLKKKRLQKKQVEAIIQKYNLNDAAEQKKIIDDYLLIQKSNRAFGRKARLHIQEKMEFMIHYNLLK